LQRKGIEEPSMLNEPSVVKTSVGKKAIKPTIPPLKLSSNPSFKEWAAIKIQRWFRQISKSHTSSNFDFQHQPDVQIQDVKLLLQEKKKKLNMTKKPSGKEGVNCRNRRKVSRKRTQSSKFTGHQTTSISNSNEEEISEAFERKVTPIEVSINVYMKEGVK